MAQRGYHVLRALEPGGGWAGIGSCLRGGGSTTQEKREKEASEDEAAAGLNCSTIPVVSAFRASFIEKLAPDAIWVETRVGGEGRG